MPNQEQPRQGGRTSTFDGTVGNMINAVLGAAVIGLGGMVISSSSQLAGFHERVSAMQERITTVESRTDQRYRRSEADIDLKDLRDRLEGQDVRLHDELVTLRARHVEGDDKLAERFGNELRALRERVNVEFADLHSKTDERYRVSDAQQDFEHLRERAEHARDDLELRIVSLEQRTSKRSAEVDVLLARYFGDVGNAAPRTYTAKPEISESDQTE